MWDYYKQDYRNSGILIFILLLSGQVSNNIFDEAVCM